MMDDGSYAGKLTEECKSMMQIGNFSPIGLNVLVVDNDPLFLLVLERMLRQCNYNVTTCSRVLQAISIVTENKDRFDLVMCEVYLPDEDGFKLLEIVGLGLDLPVIMMSTNGDTSVVMKGITHGACDYFIKPVRIEELRNIWQHVVRRRGREALKDDLGECEDHEVSDSPETTSKKRKDTSSGEFSDEVIDDISSLKRARVHWTVQLHQQFVAAVNQLGIDKAVPKKIVEIMKVQGLSRENVASHLQKYRLYLKRLSGAIAEPYPVASFQAADDSISGGKMKLQQGEKGVASPSGAKSLNLGTGVSSGLGVRGLDQSTLKSLQQYRAYQQRLVANRAQVLGGIGILPPNVSIPAKVLESTGGSKSGLQRMSSVDMGLLWKAQRQQASDENEKHGTADLQKLTQKKLHSVSREKEIVLDSSYQQQRFRELHPRHSRTRTITDMPMILQSDKPEVTFKNTLPAKSMLQDVDELLPMEDISWLDSTFKPESPRAGVILFDSFVQDFGGSSHSAATTEESNRHAFASTDFEGQRKTGAGNEDFISTGSTDISDYLVDDLIPHPR